MNGFEAYRTYLALKRHFTSPYDFHRYNGKTNVSVASYEARRDRMHFEKMAKKHPTDLVDFLVSCLILDVNSWAGEFTSNPRFEKAHTERMRRVSSLSREMVLELEARGEDNVPSRLVLFGKKQHPLLFTLHLTGRISLETMVALDTVLNLRQRWETKLSGDPTWDSFRFRLEKYRSFLRMDVEAIQKAVAAMWASRIVA